MSRHRRPVSDSELEVLKALWSGGPGTARDVERLFERREPRWAYNTLLTLLSRLRDKGTCASIGAGRRTSFAPPSRAKNC